jgi:hypothetical protein
MLAKSTHKGVILSAFLLYPITHSQMKTIFLLFVILVPVIGMSQSFSNSVVASSGSYYANGQFSVNWTLGEPIIYTYSGANLIITQGFQQNHKYIPVSVSNSISASTEIDIYPNPANEFLFIRFSDHQALNPANSQVTVSIHSMIGSEITKSTHQLFNPLLKLDLSNLAPSTYIVLVSFENHKESFVFTKL